MDFCLGSSNWCTYYFLRLLYCVFLQQTRYMNWFCKNTFCVFVLYHLVFSSSGVIRRNLFPCCLQFQLLFLLFLSEKYTNVQQYIFLFIFSAALLNTCVHVFLWVFTLFIHIYSLCSSIHYKPMNVLLPPLPKSSFAFSAELNPVIFLPVYFWLLYFSFFGHIFHSFLVNSSCVWHIYFYI